MSNQSIFVTGVPRSGTSLVAGVLKECGVFTGTCIAPKGTKENPKGFFEHKEIRQSILKPMLKDLGCDTMGQNPLPDTDNMEVKGDINIQDRVFDALKKDGYEKGPWLYKDAKLLLVWPIWEPSFPNSIWVVTDRDSEGIARSCMNTNFMRAFHTLEEWIDWASSYFDRSYKLSFHLAAKGNFFYINTDKLVKGGRRQLRNILHRLEIDLTSELEEKVTNFISKEHWHY